MSEQTERIQAGPLLDEHDLTALLADARSHRAKGTGCASCVAGIEKLVPALTAATRRAEHKSNLAAENARRAELAEGKVNSVSKLVDAAQNGMVPAAALHEALGDVGEPTDAEIKAMESEDENQLTFVGPRDWASRGWAFGIPAAAELIATISRPYESADSRAAWVAKMIDNPDRLAAQVLLQREVERARRHLELAVEALQEQQ